MLPCHNSLTLSFLQSSTKSSSWQRSLYINQKRGPHPIKGPHTKEDPMLERTRCKRRLHARFWHAVFSCISCQKGLTLHGLAGLGCARVPDHTQEPQATHLTGAKSGTGMEQRLEVYIIRRHVLDYFSVTSKWGDTNQASNEKLLGQMQFY